MATPSKNEAIKATMKATRERHAGMLCRVYEVKVVASKLSRQKKELINQLFREAKWLRNSELAKGDPKAMDRDAKTAVVKVGDVFETRELSLLGSQIRQDIVDGIKSEVKGLKTRKSKGEHVGRLKFKTVCNCIPLRQPGMTYRIDSDHSTISIQGMGRYPLKVRGLEQIPEGAEIANARFIRKASGLYFHITTYTKPEETASAGKCCGIDFGIGHNLTLDNGTVYDICIPETKGVKLASKRVNRAFRRNGGKKSGQHDKRVLRLRRAYERQNNKKKDQVNKIVSGIVNEYDFIAVQDEMIAGWHHGLFGKQVQHSSMGAIIAKLKTNSNVHVVPRSFPSTQICPACGRLTKHSLDRREYCCQFCGYTHTSRDAKAAASILEYAISKVSMERRTQSPVEIGTNTASIITDSCCKSLSVKQEAQVL